MGVASVNVHNVGHMGGGAGYHAMMAAEADMIGLGNVDERRRQDAADLWGPADAWNKPDRVGRTGGRPCRIPFRYRDDADRWQ